MLTSPPDAAQRAGITPRQARYWLEIGLASAIIDEHHGLTTRSVLNDGDLARIVTVAALVRAGAKFVNGRLIERTDQEHSAWPSPEIYRSDQEA